MLKSLKPEVEAKELSLFIGTYSELEKENKGRRYTTPSFLNNAKGKRCPFCELGNHVASKCLKFTNAASRKHTLCRKGLCFIFLNQIISQAPVILSMNVISVTANIIYVFVPSRKVTILRIKTTDNLMARLSQTFLITETTLFYKLLQLLCRI